MEWIEDEYDAVVIGGGPGGAAAAITLRQRGRRVLVLESARFPRHHVGESLVYLWPFFRNLGIEAAVDRTFVHKRGASHVWGRDRTLWTVTFSYRVVLNGRDERNYALLVHRGIFDKILLDQARAVGATVCEGHRVQSVHWEQGRPRAVSYRSDTGAEGTVRAQFVVDASGRARLLARRLELLQHDPFYPDLALYGYFVDAGRLSGENAGNVLIEATPDGWVWHIPLQNGETSVGALVAPEARERMARVRWPRFFHEQLAQTSVVQGLLHGATLVQGPIVGASSSYRSRRYAGRGWFLVGDAGRYIDPMWSSGVSIALSTGVNAGTCIDAVLAGQVSEPAARGFYNRAFEADTCGLDWLIKQSYRANRLFPQAPFWQRCHRWPGASRPPAGLLAQLAAAPALGYYRETLGLMGATDRHERPLLSGIESPVDRRRRLEKITFGECSLRLAPGISLARGAIMKGLQLERGMALRRPGGGGEMPLPAEVDWPAVLGRLAAGAPVQEVVASMAPLDPLAEGGIYGALERRIEQTRFLRQLYLDGLVELIPAA